ncbi:hypothetical protein V2O64_23570 [Verrucomicrobiaceae bacterium 227]
MDQLKEHVKESLEKNQPEEIGEAIYWKGSDPEIQEAMTEMFSSMDFASLPLVEIELHELDAYEPGMDMPGQLNGRKLVWLSEPSHWIVADMWSGDESGQVSEFNLCFAAGEVDGKWWLIGAKYSDEPIMQDLSVPGLTDTNATAIAFDEENNVTDFVHIAPDSKIQRIVFQTPEDGSRLSVVVVGPSCNEEIAKGSVVSSYVSDMSLGEVTVHVADGMVTGIFGNGVSPYCPLDAEDLKQVRDRLLEGNSKPSDRVTIIKE